MSSSDWKNTALIAALAAGFGSLLALQLANSSSRQFRYYDDDEEEENRRRSHESRRRYTDNNATLAENGHTGVPNDNEETDLNAHKGWSMAEALAAAEKESATMAKLTPREVLQSLQRGNMRFYSGHASRPEKSAFHRRALISTQFPSTAVLGCSDSRVPVEIVFDQGLGDMFVVRVAGNCLGQTTEASLEYAIHNLNVKVVLVLGHEGCGAIQAARLPLSQINKEPEALASVLRDLKSGLEDSSRHIEHILDARARDREAVATNVKNQIVRLAEDPHTMERVDQGKMKLVGGFYEISSGIVDFFMLVAKEVPGEEFKPSPGVHSRYNPRTKEIVYA